MILARMYAEALSRSVASNTKTGAQLLHGLRATLEKRGHLKLLPHIYAEFEKVEAKQRKGVTVRVAHASDRAEALKKLWEITGEKEAVVCEDEQLVSGYVVSGKDFRHDASGRRTLLDLYHRLIASK